MLVALFSSNKKKEKIRLRFIPDASQRGALLWQVLLDDSGQSQQVECFMGISADTLVLIEEISKQIVFVTPCKSILGWSAQTNGLRIYHHQGECMTIHMRDVHCERDELMEVVERLKAVSQGVPVQELTLRRNIMGQLGFHVQPDGVVTLVESAGQAWQAGLRQNSRLVEICKVAVSTLTHDQMVDLLKTSICVTLTVIPPLADGSARKGCTLQNCKYNDGNYEGDYEPGDETKHRKAPHGQRAVPGNHRIYDRSFSPPRSCGSSGYGTGGSSKSFLGAEGTLTSSSSGNSDDRWYELVPDSGDLEFGIPPPLPNKSGSVPRANNTYPSKVAHNHYAQHSKVQMSNSLPLSSNSNNYSVPLTSEYDKNNILKQLRQEDVLKARAPKSEYASVDQLYNELSRNMSEVSVGSLSQDELGNVSPRSKSLAKHTPTSNNNNVRNQSPRTLVNGEAKLRPGVTARSSNRNSANLQSSTFQEELIRLINPDNIESNEPGESMSVHGKEVILTLARPATVISNASTASSPLPGEFKHPSGSGKNKGPVGPDALPLPEDSDWSSLVDTATRALQEGDSVQDSHGQDRGQKHWEDGLVDASMTSK